MRRNERRLALLVVAVICGGCSLAPGYQVPEMAVPAHFKEAPPWTDAQPADQLPRGAWWSLFGDARLAELEQRLDANSPDLAAALALYGQAQAYEDQARAGLFPTLSGLLGLSENRQSDTRPLRGGGQPDIYGSDQVGIQASYELDLWGKVRNQVAAARAETQAAAGDLASARLSLEIRLADDYVSILSADREIRLLADTVAAYEKALNLTETLHGGGLVSGLDVSRARTELDTARAQVSESRARRALLEHAIAVLVGESPSSFSMPPDTHWIASPQIPPGLPASLLQRRPDVAAAERRVAAANASIGVARAAFFPDLSLSATIGFQSTNTDNWLMAPSTFWAVGPTLTQTLFDAGLHNAQLAAAKARLDETAARYRSTVLGAFQQVEDNLALLENYKIEYVDESAAVASAQKTLDISMTQYRDGGVSYLEVVDSQTAALAAEQAQLRLETRQVRASIDLVRALGGGWTSSDAAAAPAMKPTPAPG